MCLRNSAAEIVRTLKGPAADFTARYGALEAEGGYEAWLDPGFLPGGLMEYILRLECAKENGLFEMTLAVLPPDGEAVYSPPARAMRVARDEGT